MKILVTGATGFIGNEFLRVCREEGIDLTVLTRDLKSAGVRLTSLCEVFEWDPALAPPPREAFESVDGVVHFAGENIIGRWTSAKKSKITDSRVKSTRQLVETIEGLDKKPEVFVCASALGYYGDRGSEELTENSSSQEGFLSELCEAWEQEAFKAESFGVRTVALRTGIVLGKSGGAMQMMLPAFRLGLGGKLGSGKQWMSWVHVHDLARLVTHALKNNNVRGPVNAVSPDPVTNNEFTKTLGRTLNRPAIFPVPSLALKTIFGEMSQILLVSQKALPEKALESGFEFKYPKLSLALEEICKNPMRELVTEQWVPQPIARVFEFFSDAKNLEKLTPLSLSFKILGQSTPSLQKGTQINYRLKLHGIPFKWQSTIADWNPPNGFSDAQSKGPYAHWHHTHEFFEREGGTVIRDRAVYKVPLWVLGDALLHPFIRKDLENIFTYRRTQIENLLGGKA